jgi:hypothetical protein
MNQPMKHIIVCLVPPTMATYAPAFLLAYLASTLNFLPTYICFARLATYLTTYLPLPTAPTNLSIY